MTINQAIKMLKQFQEIELKNAKIMDEEPHFTQVETMEKVRQALVRHHYYPIEFISETIKELQSKKTRGI